MKNAMTYIIAVFVILMAAPASSNTDAVNPLVKFFGGRLSIRAVNVSLTDLVQEIRNKSGIVVDLRDAKGAEKRITIELVNLTPARALEEILRGLSFASFYNNTGLSQVLVLSPVASPPQLALSKTPQPRPQPRQSLRPGLDFEELLKRNRDEGVKAISQALKGNNRRDKLQAVEALEGFGSADDPEIIWLLGEALANSDRAVKRSALEALAEKESPDVIPLLTAGLRDQDPSVRVKVLEALNDKGALHLVRGALSDSDSDVREKAQELLESERKVAEVKGNDRRKVGRPGLQRR